MSRSSRSMFIFGFYVLVSGLFLLLFPEVLLKAAGITTGASVITRILGMVVFYLGIYYLVIGKKQLTEIIPWTIPTRASAIIFLALFVISGQANVLILGFGVLDLAGAIWTWIAWRKDQAGGVK